MGAVRIGKIRMKSGGAEIRVIDRDSPNHEGSNWRGEVVKAARRAGELGNENSDLVGYVVVGIYSDGSSYVGRAWDSERCTIPRALMPSWLAEVVRREMVTGPEAEAIACEVVNRANGFES